MNRSPLGSIGLWHGFAISFRIQNFPKTTIKEGGDVIDSLTVVKGSLRIPSLPTCSKPKTQPHFLTWHKRAFQVSNEQPPPWLQQTPTARKV